MNGALKNIKVIELGQEIQGPYAGLFLSDMGAEVIKIEACEEGDLARQMTVNRLNGEAKPEGEFTQYFYMLNRGKKSITLNLKAAEGKEVLYRLLKEADVLLTNFRPGVLDRLGFGCEDLCEKYPRLIHATASSWGPEGPWAKKPSRDMLAQAAAGVMAKTGKPGDPPMPAGIVMADYSGALMAVLAVLAAIVARNESGRGQKVDTSMYGALLALQPWEILQTSLTARENNRAGRGHQFLNGAWGAFRTQDDWIAIAGIEDTRWPDFCEIIGRPELINDPQFDKDSRNFAGERIHSLLDSVLPAKTTSEWLELFQQADIFVAAVADYSDVLSSEQALANGYIRWAHDPMVGKFKMVGSPIKMSDTPLHCDDRAPALGEHTDSLLRSIGYSSKDIAGLRSGKVI